VSCGSDNPSASMAAICRGSFSYSFRLPTCLVHRTLGILQIPSFWQWQAPTSVTWSTYVAVILVLLDPPLFTKRTYLVQKMCTKSTASPVLDSLLNWSMCISRLPPISSFGIDPEFDAAGRSGTARQHTDDIGFFDRFYEGKSGSTAPTFEDLRKETYIRDVHVFLDRAKDVATVKGCDFVRSNLSTCLQGQAFIWYTSELTDDERSRLKCGNDLDNWSEALSRQFRESPTDAMEVEVGTGQTQDQRHRYESRENAKTIVGAARPAEPHVYYPCPPANQKCHHNMSGIRTGEQRSRPIMKRSATGDTSPRSTQNRQTSVSSPTASMGDLALGKPRKTRPPAQQPELKADDEAKRETAKAEQKRPDETDIVIEGRKKQHAANERKRRDNTGTEMDKIEKSLPQLLGRPFKQSDCKKALVPKLTMLEECSDFLEGCVGLSKALGGEGQSFVLAIQTLTVEVQSLRSENRNLNKEILRLLSGRVPTPPSSNHPSPIRGSHSQPGSGSVGHHWKESHRY